jgi:hypothetical protein
VPATVFTCSNFSQHNEEIDLAITSQH